MMSSATTQRAGRAPKDKNKPQPSHSTMKPAPPENLKTSDGVVSKIQPTAEQLRIAQIVNDTKHSDYPDLKDKVERIIEITGQTSDAALVALHDCDNDSNRATIMLLEGNQDEGKWETSGKKKKNRQTQQKVPEINGHDPVPVEKEEKEPVENTNKRREPKQRDGGYRYRGPPRMNRGGNNRRNWRNKENEKNERNLQEGRRERNTDGRSRGPRRGRGRGGRSRTFQNRGLQNNDGFPESIDTWTNSTAEKVNMSNTADATMTVGNWSDVAVTEEWSEEDWAENLTETKVFTPSAGTQSSAVASALDIPTATALGQNIDLTSFLQKASSGTDSVSNSIAGGSVNQQNQSSLMSQQMVTQMQAPNVAPQSQSPFDFSQFAKQAAESIKAAVGVGTVQNTPSTPSINNSSFQSSSGSYQSSFNVSNSSNQHHVQIPHELQQVIVSQSGFSSSSSMPRELHSPVVSQSASVSSAKTTTSSQHQAPLPQRVKPPKARLPPPSKIPESAVVMPDDAVTSLDVQFGALQFGTDSSPFDFTASDNSNSYQDLGQSTNSSSHVNNQTLSSSITSQSSYSNALPSPVTLSKDSTYNLGSHNSPNQNSISNDLSQSQKVANQESILLTQNEHKTVENVSSYVNHRTNQPGPLESSMMSNKSDQNTMSSYNSSSHDSESGYSNNPYSSQKSVLNSSNLVPSSVSYTHTSSSLNSGSSDLSNSQPSQPKYQSQVVTQGQNTSSYGSGSSSYGLQQSAYSGSVTTSGSAYPSQTGYSSHASGSYGTNSSGYSSQQNVYSAAVATTTQSGTLSTSVSSSKLTNSLSHSVKDSSLLESQHNSSQHTYEVTSTANSSSVLTASSLATASSTNHSAQNSSNMSSMLGLVSTSSSTTTTSVLKNSLSATGKAVPNIPQNMPAAMLGHQYIMGQTGLPFYGLQQPVYSYEDMQMLQSKLGTLGLQSPVYSYEDMQMLQSKLSTLGYYDMQFQAPTSMTGRDPGMGSVAYTADGKYSRAETDASTVATTLSQGQASTQAHGQALFNPAAALPPGYGYYFAGGMMTGGIHHYAAPPIFPVPPATNTHGATTNSQFQKANAYGSHSYSTGYESLTQGQDYKSTYGAASQSQVKGVSGSGAVPDLSGSVYSKAHAAQLAKSYDKPGFHTGTPPPFNLAGNQAAGPLGASSAPYATQFIPVLAHGQHHSTALLHHHMQQDTSQTGGTPASGQRGPQGLGQQKNSSKQNYAAYWTSN